MIRHICMFSLKQDNKESNIAEFLRRGQELSQLPSIQAAQVVRCASGVPNANYDVALIFDFNTLDDLNAYQVSPEHVAFGQFVGDVRIDRACIDYEI
ncbi:MAG: Dabb family protein [Acutalibacter sp.]|mgnify:CR=1 FL=1|nr:Dabb family protein [Acutalibacter sp.]